MYGLAGLEHLGALLISRLGGSPIPFQTEVMGLVQRTLSGEQKVLHSPSNLVGLEALANPHGQAEAAAGGDKTGSSMLTG